MFDKITDAFINVLCALMMGMMILASAPGYLIWKGIRLISKDNFSLETSLYRVSEIFGFLFCLSVSGYGVFDLIINGVGNMSFLAAGLLVLSLYVLINLTVLRNHYDNDADEFNKNAS